MVNIICLIGYIPVTIATAVYTYQWIEVLVKNFEFEPDSSQSPNQNFYDKNSEIQASLFKQYLLNVLIPVIVTFVSSKINIYILRLYIIVNNDV